MGDGAAGIAAISTPSMKETPHLLPMMGEGTAPSMHGTPFHFVFCLDDSGSMVGQPWQQVLNAYNAFVDDRLQQDFANETLSIIVFNNSSRVHCRSVALSSRPIPTYNGGGTSFAPPLRDAIQIMKEGCGVPVLVFMSDGQAYDMTESRSLAHQMKTEFQQLGLQTHFVGFGSNVGAEALRGLADVSGGEYHAAKDGAALSDIFSDIAVTTKRCGQGTITSGGAFFASLTTMRKGGEISQETVDQAVGRLQSGKQVGSLEEFNVFLQRKFPRRPEFNMKIGQGRHPEGLAAFVVAVQWPDWQKHAVWSLHGNLYVDRLNFAKASLPPDKYRDNMAGALMHRANGNAHVAKNAKFAGLSEVHLPSWSGPRSLEEIASSAVADLRQTCTLRTMKYGVPGSSKTIFFAYQAALRNLADAMEIHAELTGVEA